MNSGRLRRTHAPEIPDRSCLLSVTSALGRYGFGSLKAEIESGRIAGSNRLGLPELGAPFWNRATKNFRDKRREHAGSCILGQVERYPPLPPILRITSKHAGGRDHECAQ